MTPGRDSVVSGRTSSASIVPSAVGFSTCRLITLAPTSLGSRNLPPRRPPLTLPLRRARGTARRHAIEGLELRGPRGGRTLHAEPPAPDSPCATFVLGSALGGRR